MPVYNPDTIKMIGNRCLRVWPLHWSQEIIYTLPCKAFSKALAKIPCSAGIKAILGARVVLVFLVLGSSSQVIPKPEKPEEPKEPSRKHSKTIEKTKKKTKKNKDLGKLWGRARHVYPHSLPRSLVFLVFFGFLDGFAMLPAGLFGLFWFFLFWNHLGRLPTTSILII